MKTWQYKEELEETKINIRFKKGLSMSYLTQIFE